MKLKEKTLKENLVFDGKVIKVFNDDVLLPNKKLGKREKIKHNGGAGVLAIEGDECFLVEQFRYAYDKTILEIPAGKLELNEKPELAAHRELEEEIGYKATSMKLLNTIYPTVGYTNEIIYIFIAEGLVKSNPNLDEDEFVNVRKMKLDDLYQLVLKNEIHDAKTVVAILSYVALKKD